MQGCDPIGQCATTPTVCDSWVDYGFQTPHRPFCYIHVIENIHRSTAIQSTLISQTWIENNYETARSLTFFESATTMSKKRERDERIYSLWFNLDFVLCLARWLLPPRGPANNWSMATHKKSEWQATLSLAMLLCMHPVSSDPLILTVDHRGGKSCTCMYVIWAAHEANMKFTLPEPTKGVIGSVNKKTMWSFQHPSWINVNYYFVYYHFVW